MKGIYFEEKGIELINKLGVKKAEFARRMGIQRQNVNALFRTNNLEIIARAAEVLEVPLALLVGYVEDPDLDELPVTELLKEEECDDWYEILPEEVPVGDSIEDVESRRKIISKFYHDWKLRNQSLRRFNLSLNEYINIRFVSITEIGVVKMTVGVRRRTHEKVQYCITALEI